MTRRTLADWLAWQETAHPSTIDLGLDRLTRVLERLGWQGFTCPVITVGGTNGKGSCVAFAEAILSAAGRRVGTFLSPHLVRYNERVRIALEEVSDDVLVTAFERIDAARGPDTLTFFEWNALAAFLVFESADATAVVLEVGLGGRLDAVNAIDPDAAVVTTVALDHCEWLGPDVASIGREKAGIFRAGRPAILGSRTMPATVTDYARAIGAQTWQIGRQFDHDADPATGRWQWSGPERCIRDLPSPGLVGVTQLDNAATAIAAVASLADRIRVPDAAFRKGVAQAVLPGRFQVIPGPVEWIVDVAHNPQAAHTLAANLAARPATGRTIGICGVLADKDVTGIARSLAQSFDRWLAAGLEGPRALAPAELAALIGQAGAGPVETCGSVAEACARAVQLAVPGDRIVAFGSFLTAGPALAWLEARQQPAGAPL